MSEENVIDLREHFDNLIKELKTDPNNASVDYTYKKVDGNLVIDINVVKNVPVESIEVYLDFHEVKGVNI